MIMLKSSSEIERMRAANAIVAEVLAHLREVVKPGMSTLDLDRMAEEMTQRAGAKPAFKGYRHPNTRVTPFPGSLCTSVNEEIVHGIPSARRVLEEGDVVSVDFGVFLQGYYGDSATTLAVGQVDEEMQKLLRVTEESLYLGIEQAAAGKRLLDISRAVQEHAEQNGFSVVREYVGHGIGRNLHEDPQVPNYVPDSDDGFSNPRLKAGMVLAIEPMVNEGGWQSVVLDDEWTVVTKDRKRSAHFEHSVAITENEPYILSKL